MRTYKEAAARVAERKADLMTRGEEKADAAIDAWNGEGDITVPFDAPPFDARTVGDLAAKYSAPEAGWLATAEPVNGTPNFLLRLTAPQPENE